MFMWRAKSNVERCCRVERPSQCVQCSAAAHMYYFNAANRGVPRTTFKWFSAENEIGTLTTCRIPQTKTAAACKMKFTQYE